MIFQRIREKHGTRLISPAKKRKQIKSMKGDQVTLETSHEKKIIEFEEKLVRKKRERLRSLQKDQYKRKKGRSNDNKNDLPKANIICGPKMNSESHQKKKLNRTNFLG